MKPEGKLGVLVLSLHMRCDIDSFPVVRAFALTHDGGIPFGELLFGEC